MEGDDLFDEFGNLVGVNPLDSDEEEEEVLDEQELYETDITGESGDKNGIKANPFISVGNDKGVGTDLGYPYGKGVEVLIETENTQSVKTPLVKPVAERSKLQEHTIFTQLKKNIPKTKYNRDYMLSMTDIPERIINVGVIGPLHSGKTSLMDLLIIDSHKRIPDMSKNTELGWKPLRYMDNMKQEIDRGISIKLNGSTLLCTNLESKSNIINFLDAPGHTNFIDETAVAFAASDLALIVIDVVEGVTSVVEQLIKQSIRNKLAMCFVINKLDRLILDLKLPPMDAYFKLNHIIKDINSFTKGQVFSPAYNNIIFASAKLGFTFTVKEFVAYNYSHSIPPSKIDDFITRLWGSVYFHKGNFQSKPFDSVEGYPTFVEFILNPIYKIFSYALSMEKDKLKNLLRNSFRINLRHEVLKYDPQPFLKHVLQLIFKEQTGLVDSITRCYEPLTLTDNKVNQLSSPGKHTSKDILWAHVLKTLDYGGTEWSLVRIYSGLLKRGDKVRILDTSQSESRQKRAIINNTEIESFDKEEDGDDDETPMCTVEEIGLLGGRYVYPLSKAHKGQIVLVKGISSAYIKSATLYSVKNKEDMKTLKYFRPLDYITEAVFKIVLQPLLPKELPKLLHGLNKVTKYYPGVVVKVEESGEHVILGNGELYMDCLLYDLRTRYADIEIKISDPLTVFSESCSNESFASIPVNNSISRLNDESSLGLAISVTAEPLDFKMIQDLSKNVLGKGQNYLNIDEIIDNPRKLSKILRTEYGWDSLASRNVWSFYNGNVLINDTLPGEVSPELLSEYKQQIIQGFYWAVKEGPLAEEPIYGVQYKLLSITIPSDTNIDVIKSQIIPLMRKACYVGLLTATPALLEPVYEVNITVHAPLLPIVEELVKKRRGSRIYKTIKVVGTPLMEIRGQIPVIESPGFEIDLRLCTNGLGMCQLYFWHKIWRKVPGDVLDKDAFIPKLKAAPVNSLSRDFVMKTRRRKGISTGGFMSNDGPTLEKYISAELFVQLRENGLIP
ncbi:hypothetical protein SMKI_11G0480 [Saccharomyces mikatae IFO 1815]|uniref:Tr-type G domain-containing protein n=1 Tax=Saccharomyces mikatae IFO 1815 TaxID=226126 RepID=A0AA35IPN0_SACMI|nr:uncharacterized protein SMKI_11G0480 [Saccharomyces mikatae IFO 1815]CAI4034602.1 hypothetical protein SMKI_11G0480 [Saccharomyces mikatae IFO 1815]